jgi:acetyl esterase/lipase
LTNPVIQTIDRFDPFLGLYALRRAGIAYAGGSPLDNFMVSPINGGFKGLGEIHLFVGTYDILVADARKLKLLAEEEGVFVHYHEYADMVHMWMFMNFPEARIAQREILDCLQ